MEIPSLEEFDQTIPTLSKNPEELQEYVKKVISFIYSSGNKKLAEEYRRVLSEYKFEAKRGNQFTEEIRKLLRLGNIKEKCITSITTPKNMKKYELAFNHPSYDDTYNYESFEFFGDSVANACIVRYVYETYPQLRTPFGVKVSARLKINYGSSKSFANFDNITDMQKFVACSLDVKYYDTEALQKSKEDVFEAFFGCTSTLVDEKFGDGVGFIVCYKIIKALFDKIPMTMKYSTLYDPVTRLKELHDEYRAVLGVQQEKHIQEGEEFVSSYLSANNEILGTGNAKILKDAQRIAAEKAIDTLREKGFRKTDKKGDFARYEELGVEMDV